MFLEWSMVPSLQSAVLIPTFHILLILVILTLRLICGHNAISNNNMLLTRWARAKFKGATGLVALGPPQNRNKNRNRIHIFYWDFCFSKVLKDSLCFKLI